MNVLVKEEGLMTPLNTCCPSVTCELFHCRVVSNSAAIN